MTEVAYQAPGWLRSLFRSAVSVVGAAWKDRQKHVSEHWQRASKTALLSGITNSISTYFLHYTISERGWNTALAYAVVNVGMGILRASIEWRFWRDRGGKLLTRDHRDGFGGGPKLLGINGTFAGINAGIWLIFVTWLGFYYLAIWLLKLVAIGGIAFLVKLLVLRKKVESSKKA